MYYSFGAHPGFNCKIGDYLEFDNPQASVMNEQIDDESLLLDNQVELLKNEKRITLEKDTFDHDALILSGYTDKVIMAAGAFTMGSSIELSCDAPIREPYVAFQQGGLTYEYGKLGVLKAIQNIIKE